MALIQVLLFMVGLVIGVVITFICIWRNEAKVEKFTSANSRSTKRQRNLVVKIL